LDRAEELLTVLPRYIEELSQFAQSFGVAPLAAVLLIPIIIAALAREFTLALAAALLSFVSLSLFIAPTSEPSSLAIASGLGSFLVGLESIIALKRTSALKKEIADLTRRLDQLENAEQRRLLLEVKARHEAASDK
jgi:K+-sensing histidine kinase KdpD